MSFKSEDYIQLQLWPAEDLPPLQLCESEEEEEDQPIHADSQPSFVQLTLPGREVNPSR